MHKKVFISYSWGSKEHQDWVSNLGARLRNDSVDVILDKWDLKDGQDIFSFMESMVSSDDIYRVLVICDKNYQQKADKRKGGVGTETQIITPEIYGNHQQTKFIPIVVERDEQGNSFLPVYLKGRKYLDFSEEEYFEENYEELLRNILEAPSEPKPKLGSKPPAYIIESVVNNSSTRTILKTLDSQIRKDPRNLNSCSLQFIEEFMDSLWDFEEDKKGNGDLSEFGSFLLDKLKSYKPLREDFISFLQYAANPVNEFDIDILIDFFSKRTTYKYPRNKRSGSISFDSEIFGIIFHELFLYTVSVGLHNKNYSFVADLFHSKYYFGNRYSSKVEAFSFTVFAEYHELLNDYYREILRQEYGFGSYITKNISHLVKREHILLADILCHYVGDLLSSNSNKRDKWFPYTYIYNEDESGYAFFDKMNSRRFFEKVKVIFDADGFAEFNKHLAEYQERKNGTSRPRIGHFDEIPFLHEIIDLSKIGRDR